MYSRYSFPATVALIAVCSGSLCGCSSGDPNKGIDVRPVHSVKGVVTFEGKPVAGATIGFRPLSKSSSPYNPQAISKADGSYALSTYRLEDGAPPGDYVVTIYWPASTGKKKGRDEEEDAGVNVPDRFGGRYDGESKSPLRATVVPGENTVDFKLP